MKYTFLGILFAIPFTIFCFCAVRLMTDDSSQYSRWQELSTYEHDYLVRCVEHQPFFTCTANIHEMRQIGVIP